MRKAEVRYQDQIAGWLIEDERGYHFYYDEAYLAQPSPQPVSKTLPLTASTYSDRMLFPFFDGLIPEGWLLVVAERNWKLKGRDRMGLLMACCRDCIGAVSIFPAQEESQ